VKVARKLLPLAMVAAAIFPAASSGAAIPQVHVEINDYFFAPGGNVLSPGSQVVLYNAAGQGDHQIQAYSGASWETQLLKPGRGTIVPYNGGMVLYRCALHSTLDYSRTPPACSGMCGVLQSDPDYLPPQVTITTPNDFRFNGPVRIDGRATDDHAVVHVFVTFTPVAQVPFVLATKTTRATCFGCGQSSLTWRGQETSLQAGRYEVVAHAVDAAGNTAESQPITILALAPRIPRA
jgi:plastocyanin